MIVTMSWYEQRNWDTDWTGGLSQLIVHAGHLSDV